MRIASYRCPECRAFLHARPDGYARCPNDHGATMVEPVAQLDASLAARLLPALLRQNGERT